MDTAFDNERQNELNERIAGEIAMMSQEAAASLQSCVNFDISRVCFTN